VNLRNLEGGRAYRCVLSEGELRETYKMEAEQNARK
jgi:hypothetical protein